MKFRLMSICSNVVVEYVIQLPLVSGVISLYRISQSSCLSILIFSPL